jgi:hypothetical protein
LVLKIEQFRRIVSIGDLENDLAARRVADEKVLITLARQGRDLSRRASARACGALKRGMLSRGIATAAGQRVAGATAKS